MTKLIYPAKGQLGTLTPQTISQVLAGDMRCRYLARGNDNNGCQARTKSVVPRRATDRRGTARQTDRWEKTGHEGTRAYSV